MIGFLTGAVLAATLAILTWVSLEAFAVTSIDRIDNSSHNLEDVDHRY